MASSSFSASSRPALSTMRSARASRLRRLNFPVPLPQVKPTSVRTWQHSCAAACARSSTPGVRPEGKLEQVFRVRPDGHPMHVEPPTDRDHALAARSGRSDSVHLALRERCSSSSPRVRDDSRLIVSGTVRLVAENELRLIPRGTQPFEPLPGVRFESTHLHLVRRRFSAPPPFSLCPRRAPERSISPDRPHRRPCPGSADIRSWWRSNDGPSTAARCPDRRRGRARGTPPCGAGRGSSGRQLSRTSGVTRSRRGAAVRPDPS